MSAASSERPIDRYVREALGELGATLADGLRMKEVILDGGLSFQQRHPAAAQCRFG